MELRYEPEFAQQLVDGVYNMRESRIYQAILREGRDEGLISVLSHQLVALGVHYEHQPRRSEGRDLLLDAGQSRGG